MSGGMGGGEEGVDPPTTTKGDVSGFDTTFARIPIGTNNQVLTADSAQALGLKWADAAGAPTTTKGDISGFSTTQARIPIGANGQVLEADSTEALGLKWATAPTGLGKARFLGSTSLASANTEIEISSLSLDLVNDYTSIQVNCTGYSAGVRGTLECQVGGSSGTYNYDYIRQDATTVTGGQVNGATSFKMLDASGSGSYYFGVSAQIMRFLTSGISFNSNHYQKLDSSGVLGGYRGGYSGPVTITSVKILSSQDMAIGTSLSLWGVIQ